MIPTEIRLRSEEIAGYGSDYTDELNAQRDRALAVIEYLHEQSQGSNELANWVLTGTLPPDAVPKQDIWEAMRDVELQSYRQDLRGADPNSDESFKSLLLRGYDLLGITDKEVAHSFGASRPTIERWKSGANSPHPMARPMVYNWLLQRKEVRGLLLFPLSENEDLPALDLLIREKLKDTESGYPEVEYLSNLHAWIVRYLSTEKLRLVEALKGVRVEIQFDRIVQHPVPVK